MIIDDNPIVEFYNCGNRQNLSDEIIDINKIITGRLDKLNPENQD